MVSRIRTVVLALAVLTTISLTTSGCGGGGGLNFQPDIFLGDHTNAQVVGTNSRTVSCTEPVFDAMGCMTESKWIELRRLLREGVQGIKDVRSLYGPELAKMGATDDYLGEVLGKMIKIRWYLENVVPEIKQQVEKGEIQTENPEP